MPKYISQTELARQLGISRARIHTLTRQGTFQRTKSKRYDLELCRKIYQERIDQKNRPISSMAGKGSIVDMVEARAKEREIDTQIKQTKLDQLNGKLVDIDEVRRQGMDVVLRTRQRLLAVPAALAPRIFLLETVEAIEEMLKNEINSALTDLSELADA